MVSYGQKCKWLKEHGFIRTINGEPMMNVEAVALLGGVTVPDIMDSIKRTGGLTSELLARMRKRATELRAKHHSNDMVDILYGEASFDGQKF